METRTTDHYLEEVDALPQTHSGECAYSHCLYGMCVNDLSLSTDQSFRASQALNTVSDQMAMQGEGSSELYVASPTHN